MYSLFSLFTLNKKLISTFDHHSVFGFTDVYVLCRRCLFAHLQIPTLKSNERMKKITTAMQTINRGEDLRETWIKRMKHAKKSDSLDNKNGFGERFVWFISVEFEFIVENTICVRKCVCNVFNQFQFGS